MSQIRHLRFEIGMLTVNKIGSRSCCAKQEIKDAKSTTLRNGRPPIQANVQRMFQPIAMKNIENKYKIVFLTPIGLTT